MRRRLTGALAVAAIAALVASAALGEQIRVKNLVVSVKAIVTPVELPATRFAPIALTVDGGVRTTDGSHPPAVNRLVLEFDRNGTLFTGGLPVCDPGLLEGRRTDEALKACRPALVGRGVVKAAIDLPGQAPFTAAGPLLIFNGPRSNGQPSVIFHVYADVPAATAFVVQGEISKATGNFGKRVTIDVPSIAGGAGSLIHFTANVHRRWSFKGTRRSYLLARCRNGQFQSRGSFKFDGGTVIEGPISRACRSSG